MLKKTDLMPVLKSLVEGFSREYEVTLHGRRLEKLDRMRKLAAAINHLWSVIEIIDELPS